MISKQSQSVTYGNTINLEATIVSLPAPVSIQWGKDGDPIQSDSIKFATDRLDDGTNRLSIRYLEFNDSGKYSVLVTNALGSTYKEIDIVVKGILHPINIFFFTFEQTCLHFFLQKL